MDENDTKPELVLARTAAITTRLDELAEAARQTMNDGVPWNTKRTYISQWALFQDWCTEFGLQPLPASSETLVLYLTDRSRKVKVSTLNVALAAITFFHRLDKSLDPKWAATDPPEVRALLRGLRRAKQERPTKKKAFTLDALREGLPAGTSKKAIRDRAILLVGFFTAMRRSELVAIKVLDLSVKATGISIRLSNTKTDKALTGQDVFLPELPGDAACPVAALRAWIEAGEIEGGLLFRSLRGGEALQAQKVATIVKKAAMRAGFDPRDFAGHSLRSGFATSAASAHVEERDIMGVTRHRSERMVREYIQDVDREENHPGRKIAAAFPKKRPDSF